MKNKTILITGAGPTGLTMANLLTKMEIPFLLIDKNPHPSRNSKAFGVHARTLEIFDQLGIAKKAIHEGKIDNTLHLLIKGREAAKLRLKEILPGETNYPYLLILQQDKTERLMIEALEGQGQKVHWKHELIQFKEYGNLVIATIKEPTGAEKEMQFQLLIGCDGAGSTVRGKAGFDFKGKTFSPTFYLADCEIDWKFTHGDIYFIFSPGYLSGLFSFPEKNKFRIFNFMNLSVEKEKDADLSVEEVQKIIDSNPYLRMRAKNTDWTSVFKIHARFTGKFQKGRIFLAGDAAHVHSPAAAQGMNTGIQDAYNLAWKLSLVVKGMAQPQLLNSYHEERYPIAKNLHYTTDRLFQLMIQKNKLADFFRLYILPKVFRIVFGIKWIRVRNLRRISQLAIKYRYSSLSKKGTKDNFYRKAPKPGDRAPYCKITLHGEESDVFQLFKCTHFTLLIAISDPETKLADRVYEQFKNRSRLPINIYRITEISAGYSFFDVYGIKKDAIFIVRPDSHIGFRSSRLDYQEIEDYFARDLGMQ